MSASINLVAQFLKDNGYDETLRLLEKECSSKVRPEYLPHTGESLDDLVRDRVRLSILVIDEAPVVNPMFHHWRGVSLTASSVFSLPDRGMLVLSMCHDPHTDYTFFSASDALVHYFKGVQYGGRFGLSLGRLVVKKILCVGPQQILLATMDGKLRLCRYTRESSQCVLSEAIDAHKRVIIDIRCVQLGNRTMIITLGFDRLVKVYELVADSLAEICSLLIGATVTCFDAATVNDQLLITVGKLESTVLDIITFSGDNELHISGRVSINDAEFCATAFTPTSISIRTLNGRVLVAAGTSHEPHMRLIIVDITDTWSHYNESTVRDKIICNVNTMSPQDSYSQGIIHWRSDGNDGVWVAGDDGIVRGIDIHDGSIAAELSGHKGRIKSMYEFDSKIWTSGIDREILVWSA